MLVLSNESTQAAWYRQLYFSGSALGLHSASIPITFFLVGVLYLADSHLVCQALPLPSLHMAQSHCHVQTGGRRQPWYSRSQVNLKTS